MTGTGLLPSPPTVGVGAWLRSVPRALRDLASGRTRCHAEHVGEVLRMSDGRTYVLFRHTRKAKSGWSRTAPAAVLQPRFHLAALAPGRRHLHALFRVVCIVTTPLFVGLRGFRSKLWMVDPATGDFAGLYEWDDADPARSVRRRPGSHPPSAVGPVLGELRAGRRADGRGLPRRPRPRGGHLRRSGRGATDGVVVHLGGRHRRARCS